MRHWLVDSQQRLTELWPGQAAEKLTRPNKLGQVAAVVEGQPSVWREGKVHREGAHSRAFTDFAAFTMVMASNGHTTLHCAQPVQAAASCSTDFFGPQPLG